MISNTAQPGPRRARRTVPPPQLIRPASHDVPEVTAMALSGNADDTSLSIQRARRDDMGAVAELVRSSAEWYRPFLDEKDMAEHEVDQAWAERNFRIREFYLGVVDDSTVGTVSVQRLGDYAYLGYIYLDVNFVGRGIGQRLMSFAENVARDWDVRGLALIAHPKAEWAKRAYLKYGFEIVESQKRRILDWQQGALRPYYEEGFELYTFEFESHAQQRAS